MDIASLTDPTRCPDCATLLPEAPVACPTCSLPLTGPLADRLWRLSTQAADLLGQRAAVLEALRQRKGAVLTGVGARATEPRRPATLPQQATRWSEPVSEPKVHEPVTPRQIQKLLLTLGVLLVSVAAVIFTVVAWGRVGIGGRTAILATLTVASAAGCRAAFRRELPGTAEALGTLTLGFCLLDAYGIRRYDLAGAGGTAADAYWAAVIGGLALLAVAAHRAVPLRVLEVVAAVGIQLPLPMLSHRLPDVSAAIAGLAQGTALIAGTRAVRSDTRFVLLVGGLLAYVGSATMLAVFAYGNSPEVVVPAAQGAGLLLLVALTAAALAWLHRDVEGATSVGAAVAAASLLGAGHAPMYRAWSADAAATGGAALLLALTVLLVAIPRLTAGWRVGPLLVIGAGGLAALRTVGAAVAGAVGGELRWPNEPWSRPLHASARQMLGEPWAGSGLVLATLVLLTAVATLIAVRAAAGAEILAGLVAGGLATLTVLVLPVAVDAPYLASVLSLILVGGALLVVAARLTGVDDLAIGLALAGTAMSFVGLVWSLAVRSATPLALGGILLAALAVRGLGRRDEYRLAATVVAALTTVTQTGVLMAIAGQAAERAGTAAVLAAGILAVAAGLLPSPRERLALEAASLFGAVVAFLQVTSSAQWTWISLLIAGCAAALVAFRRDRHQVGWLAGLLLAASSWVRLAMAHVDVPEAYTTGPALALLVVGFVARRREREVELTSWEAYGAGLTVGLLPSLAATFGDESLLRPLLLGGVALAVLLLGVRSKLAAPLAIGGAVLAIDAVVQLGPYAAALPRWITIGGAGLLLLVLGMTFERRLRDFRRVAAKIADLA